MKTMQRLYPYSYEQNGNDGQPQLEVAFDSEGVIGAIFAYNEAVDAMVLTDVVAFETRHPSKYNFLQEKVNEMVMELETAINESLQEEN